MRTRSVLALAGALLATACTNGHVTTTNPVNLASLKPSVRLDDVVTVAAVKAALAEVDPGSTLRIGVKANHGTVTLSGAVRDNRERKALVDRAYAVTGVSSVDDRTHVQPGIPATLRGPAGVRVAEALLETRVQIAVLTATGPHQIRARAQGSVVTLEGRVPDAATRERAVAAARAVSGVRNVVDHLAVVGT